MKPKTLRLLEFAVIGVIFGMVEDILAVILVTDEPISFKVIWVVFLITIPFAFISEYVVDHPKFWKIFFKKQ